MEKNETVVAVCESLGTQGEGVVKYGDVTLFVPYLLPGERAEIKILKRKGNIGYGKATEILTPAEARVRPVCPVFTRCGGCQLQHIRYGSQLKFKTKLVADSLKKIGGIAFPVSACERSEREYGYRNKLQIPIGRQKGKNVVGFFAEHSHRIVETHECPIHPEWSEKFIDALYRFMEKCGLDGYEEETGEGQLRHAVVRELKNKFIVTLVVTVPEIKGIDYLFYLLDQIFPKYSFYLNYNDGRTNVVFGGRFELLKGGGFYNCVESGIEYQAGANTFVQVNDAVRSKLYERALSLVSAGDVVIDCYAGGGLLTAMFAKKCGRAYGIEIVPEAHLCAERMKERNALAGMTNICGKVEEELSAILLREPNAAVVLDPPRAGVERSVLKTLIALKIRQIVMISCNPATLARDLGILTGTLVEDEAGALVKTANPNGAYELVSVEPFDMFPQTRHVETLVCLRMKKSP